MNVAPIEYGSPGKPGKVPGIRTSKRFRARYGSDDGFGKDQRARRYARRRAAAAGVSTAGKRYEPQLADYLGDPRAWIDGPDDIKRICRKRGWACDGAVSVAAPKYVDVPDDKPYRVAEDLVQKHVRRGIVEQGLRPTPKQHGEMLEAARERLAGNT